MRALLLLTLLAVGCVPKKRYTSELADLNGQLGAMTEARDQAASDAAVQQANARSADARAEELDRLAQDLEARNAQLKGRLEALEGQVAELAARGSSAQAAKEQLEAAVAALRGEVAAAEDQARETRARLEEIKAEKEKLEAKTAEYDELMASMEAEIASGQVKITELAGKLTVNLSNAILFDSGSYVLRADGQEALKKVAGVLAKVKDRDIRVEGHTDNVPVRAGAAFADNWALSSLRASTVVALLVANGVDPGNVQAVGYGEHHPLQPNDSAEGRAANRRTEIVLAPRLQIRGAVEE
ncbi:MAG: OmpA family protein [Pseudomonadota bacterium]